MIMKAALVFLCLLAATSGSGDSQVYPSGRTNPNLRYTSYYRDAQDVLDDLSSFQSLYVTFHSCVYVIVSLKVVEIKLSLTASQME